MCRWLAYSGAPVLLEDLLYRPEHSLIVQSMHSTLGAEATNGDGFGVGSSEQPEKVVLEFVSANPTGPLTAASGRHAAFGDALARILDQAGHTVSREYYFNDAGSQIDRLGESIRARARGEADDNRSFANVHRM